VEELQTAEIWNKAYADELRPLYQQINEHRELAQAVSQKAWEGAKNVENVKPTLETALMLHFEAAELAKVLGELESELRDRIQAYDAMAETCREDRRAAVESYSLWYGPYNNVLRERSEIEDHVGAGMPEMPY
jgi:hypothetical protein